MHGRKTQLFGDLGHIHGGMLDHPRRLGYFQLCKIGQRGLAAGLPHQPLECGLAETKLRTNIVKGQWLSDIAHHIIRDCIHFLGLICTGRAHKLQKEQFQLVFDPLHRIGVHMLFQHHAPHAHPMRVCPVFCLNTLEK